LPSELEDLTTANADLNTARNIRAKAIVKSPMAGSVEAKAGLNCG
jgi:hypothetical protein